MSIGSPAWWGAILGIYTALSLCAMLALCVAARCLWLWVAGNRREMEDTAVGFLGLPVLFPLLAAALAGVGSIVGWLFG